MKNNDTKKTPFGDKTTTTYSYNDIEDNDIILDDIDASKRMNIKTLDAVKIFAFFATALILLMFSVINIAAYMDKKEALDSINKVNEGMVTISKVFASEELLGNLREKSRSYGDSDVEQLFSDAADAGRSVADNTGKIEEEMNNDEAKLEVYNYYKLCESINNIPVGDDTTSDAKRVCASFTEDAKTMMKTIKLYNESRKTVIGGLSFIVPTPHLPDVTSYEK